MRFRVVLIFAMLAAVALAPVPGRAASYTISMKDDPPGEPSTPVYFQARTLSAPAGSTITWANADADYHTVTAYYGAAFASNAVGPAGSFTTTYPGGTVLYRCLYHAYLDERVSPPACFGMCGAIHDIAQDLQAPVATITTPNGFVFTGAVRIDGRATDNRSVSTVKVSIKPVVEIPVVLSRKEGFAEDASSMNPCIGCHGPMALWTFRSDPAVGTRAPVLNLPPGQYRVDAQAVDPHGNVGDATPISIYVLQ